MRNIITELLRVANMVNNRRITISWPTSALYGIEQILSFPNDKPTVWRRNITTEELIKWYTSKTDFRNRCSRGGQ